MGKLRQGRRRDCQGHRTGEHGAATARRVGLARPRAPGGAEVQAGLGARRRDGWRFPLGARATPAMPLLPRTAGLCRPRPRGGNVPWSFGGAGRSGKDLVPGTSGCTSRRKEMRAGRTRQQVAKVRGTEMGEGRPGQTRGRTVNSDSQPPPQPGMPGSRAGSRGASERGADFVLGQGSGPPPAPLVRRGESCKAALFARPRPSSPRGMHKAPGASASGHPFFGNKMCAMPALLPGPAPAPAPFYL